MVTWSSSILITNNQTNTKHKQYQLVFRSSARKLPVFYLIKDLEWDANNELGERLDRISPFLLYLKFAKIKCESRWCVSSIWKLYFCLIQRKISQCLSLPLFGTYLVWLMGNFIIILTPENQFTVSVSYIYAWIFSFITLIEAPLLRWV